MKISKEAVGGCLVLRIIALRQKQKKERVEIVGARMEAPQLAD